MTKKIFIQSIGTFLFVLLNLTESGLASSGPPRRRLPNPVTNPPAKRVKPQTQPTLGPSKNLGNKSLTGSVSEGFYNNADGSPVLNLLDSATQSTDSIDIEIYTMQDPAVRASLRQALARGVRVRIIQEPSPLGTSCRVFSGSGGNADCIDMQNLVSEVNNQKNGSKYIPFNTSALCGVPGKVCFEHGKLVIVRSKNIQTAMLSTGNLDATNLCDKAANPLRCNRDYSYVISNPQLVGALESIFESDFKGVAYDVSALIPNPINQSLTVSPFSLQPLVDFISSATKTIEIENQYLKEPTINAALTAAATRKIDVHVTVASICAFGAPKPPEAAQWTATFQKFENAGIHVRIFDKQIQINSKPGYLHAKAILVDGKRAWVGSVNGSAEATSNNREFGIFFEDPAQVRALESIITSDENNPDGETWQESLKCTKG